MITELIQKDLHPPHIEDIGISILTLMEEYKVHHMPITSDKNIFHGVICENDVINMSDLQKSLHFIKNKFQNTFAYLDVHLFECMKIIIENKLSLLPIINRGNIYVGYITPYGIVNKLNQFYRKNRSNVTIIIESYPKNYSIAEISRIIEENNSKIQTLWSELREDKIHLHICISSKKTKSIIQELERYDYKILKTFSQEKNDSNVNEHFESFIKYLNT